MNLFKKSISALLCLGLMVSCSKEDDAMGTSGSAITNLEFIIESSGLGNTVSVTPSASGATSYSVDFGNTEATDDVLATVGPKVTYVYPSAAATYNITVTASATGADNVVLTKEHAVVISIPQTDVIGRWVLLHQAGALAVGPEVNNYSWWSNSLADVNTRNCLFDDVYEFKSDGTFVNVLGNETWVEPVFGNDPEGCATPVAPFDGTATATWFHNETENTVTITGKGAYLGLAKVANTLFTSPTAAPESVTYSAVGFSEDKNIMTVQISSGTDFWQFKLAKEGTAGAAIADVDTDGDGVNDADDACPNVAGTNNGCPVVTDVTTVPTTPSVDAANVISIYSDAYTSVGNVNVNPGWGQATQFAELEPATGNKVLQYSFLDYQGTTFDAISLAGYTHIHFDVHSSEIDKLNITLINTADSSGSTFEVGVDKTLTSGQWTSIDIPLSEFVGLTESGAIDQLKYGVSLDGTATGATSFHVDNIYLYK